MLRNAPSIPFEIPKTIRFEETTKHEANKAKKEKRWTRIQFDITPVVDRNFDLGIARQSAVECSASISNHQLISLILQP